MTRCILQFGLNDEVGSKTALEAVQQAISPDLIGSIGLAANKSSGDPMRLSVTFLGNEQLARDAAAAIERMLNIPASRPVCFLRGITHN